MTRTPFRPLRFGITRISVREGAPGVRYVRAEADLTDFPWRITDRFAHWAQVAPDQPFLARRVRLAEGGTGDWQMLGFRQAWVNARSMAQALIDRGLSVERPVVVLSENSFEHALVALGCVLAGVPFVPVSPAYSLVSRDFEKLRHVLAVTTPGLVFASDDRYTGAIAATVGPDVEVVMGKCLEESLAGARLAAPDVTDAPFGTTRPVTSLVSLLTTDATSAVDQAIAATGPDTIVKFLFTSGSTKLPKAVINTQRMWCANQQQMAMSMPVLAEAPPVLVDWLPWNHTFGGNHNFGMVLFHGGTLYIDDGKPTPALMPETLRNLREVSPTVYFNVPTGFEAIARAMQTDDVLRRSLLSRVRMFFYSGAALAQPIWDSLWHSQEREIGERIVMGTGLGMTESAPFAVFITNPEVRAGDIGVPAAGLELKLVDTDVKTEVRYRGPNITPGYWRAPKQTAESFDEEGFFRTGDAVLWINPDNPHLGLRFDGRIAEDFKLATGTFVSVGPLRARIIAAGAPQVQDAVITGLNRNEIGALIFPAPAVRALAGLAPDAPLAEVLAAAPVRAHFQTVLDALAGYATGSASRVARLALLAEPPSLDLGEVTDKGSINQRAVLRHRAALVEALHEGSLPGLFLPR